MKKILLILSFLLCTCAIGPGHYQIVQENLQQQNTQLIGLHKDDVLMAKGVPDYQAQLSTGQEVWTWRSTKTGSRKGSYLTIGGDARTNRPIISWTETVNLIIGKDGVVKEVKILVE